VQDHLFDQMEDVQQQHFWFRARAEILLWLLRGRLQDGDTVLDVGCGTGWLLSLLPPNLRLMGLDPSDHALSLAKKRLEAKSPLALDLRSGILPDKPAFDSECADWIFLTDVLEHVEDDQGALEALRALLKTDGQMIITVPAFDFLWSQHDVEHRHFRRYRRKGLGELLEASGFTIETLSYYNCRLFPMVLLVRWLKKLLGREGDDMALPSPRINSLLRGIFAGEKHRLQKGSYPFGVSLIAVVKK
jgi:SAM-dependent methyltransferase